MPHLELMASDESEVGDIVLAIGTPFGVGQTVTRGIISALARTQIGGTDFRSYIQTDASINPENSGGALVTLDGRLAGINIAIYSNSGGSIGIGFAIPADLVRTVIDGAASGHLARPWLGAAGQLVISAMAEGLGLDRLAVADELGLGFAARGVIVVRTLANSRAGRLQVQLSDIVLFVNDKRIVLVDDLVDAVRLPRDSWHLSIRRGERTLKVAIGG